MLIREKDKLALIEIFSNVESPFEVWAYGSRVNGSAHAGSDLDLIARAGDLTPLPAALLNDLCKQINDSNIPILVELGDWARIPDSFRLNIEKEHEILYSNRQ